MDKAREIALIAACYLSRFDREAVKALGFGNTTAAFHGIGDRLRVPPNTIKNMRDEFDPIYDNPRVGWYQRPLRPSRARVAEMLQDVEFTTLTGIVRDLIFQNDYRRAGEVQPLLDTLIREEQEEFHAGDSAADEAHEGVSRDFIARAPTIRRASELFLQWYYAGDLPFSGHLVDRRDDGCGYDFMARDVALDEQLLIAVKGLAEGDGGIQFTDREWQIARTEPGSRIFLVAGIGSESPSWRVIDPSTTRLQPERVLRTVIQVKWRIDADTLLSAAQ